MAFLFCDVLEEGMNEEGRPDEGFEEAHNACAEARRVPDEIHGSADEAEPVDAARRPCAGCMCDVSSAFHGWSSWHAGYGTSFGSFNLRRGPAARYQQYANTRLISMKKFNGIA